MPEKMFLESVLRMPLMALPVRTVVLNLSTGTILLSPGSKLSKEDLALAGEVTDIVAPSLLHCGGVKLAAEVNPEARVWGPIAAGESKADLPWSHFLGKDKWIHEKELRLIPIQGMPNAQESVFVDVASKTLYVTDLFFNLQKTRGIGARIILGLFGTYQKFAVSKLFLRYVKDRSAFERSLKEILSNDFNRVVMAHGEILEPARQAVEAAIRERGI